MIDSAHPCWLHLNYTHPDSADWLASTPGRRLLCKAISMTRGGMMDMVKDVMLGSTVSWQLRDTVPAS